jgi:hypothetical protein
MWLPEMSKGYVGTQSRVRTGNPVPVLTTVVLATTANAMGILILAL